jgi:hypothetical protein
MFIKERAREATPLGVVCRTLLSADSRLKSLCLMHILKKHSTSDLVELEASILAMVNSLLLRHSRPMRALAISPNRRQHHIELVWATSRDGWKPQPTELINLYPPSKRKPDGEDDSSADTASRRVRERAHA